MRVLIASRHRGPLPLHAPLPAADAASITGDATLRVLGRGAQTTLVADTRSSATGSSDATVPEASETHAYGVKAPVNSRGAGAHPGRSRGPRGA